MAHLSLSNRNRVHDPNTEHDAEAYIETFIKRRPSDGQIEQLQDQIDNLTTLVACIFNILLDRAVITKHNFPTHIIPFDRTLEDILP